MVLKASANKGSSIDATLDAFAKRVGSERAGVELPANPGADVEWTMHLNPKAGRYEVRVAVRVGDRVGSVGYVEVPKG